MRIGTATPPAVQAVSTPVVKPEAAASEPKDKVDTSSNEPSSGRAFAQMAITGVGGVALTALCAYPAMAGGAIVGGLFGGALGPVAGALSNHGVMSALGTAFTAGGIGGHIGVVLGTAASVVGAFTIAHKVGSIGMHHDPSKQIKWGNPVNATVGTVLVTAGLAAGAAGGLVLFGGAAAAGTLVNGLIQHHFTAAALTGIGTNALIAGGAGGTLAMTVGGAGGYGIASLIGRGVDAATAAIKDHK